MTPLLTPEQLELKDSFRALLAEHVSLAVVRKLFEAGAKRDASTWKKIMELGALQYFSEAPDAGGGSLRDLGIIAAEAGFALLPENLTDAALVVHLVATKISDQEREQLKKQFGADIVEALVSGELRAALSVPKKDFVTVTKADATSGVLKIDAEARFVSSPSSPDLLLLCDLSSDSLWLCDLRATSSGKCMLTPEKILDRTELRYSLSISDTPAFKISSIAASEVELLIKSIKSAELSGAARRALEMTVEYLKTREQFDVPIGGFQAVQHAAADMLVRVEALAALSDFACWAADSSPDQLKLAALSASLFGADEAPKVIEKAIQLHGGIGFTWEHDLHLFLRRARTLSALIGPDGETFQDLIDAAQAS